MKQTFDCWEHAYVDWNYMRSGFEGILNIILSVCNGDVKDKTFLEVGPSRAYILYRLTSMGAKTIGVDEDQENLDVARFLGVINDFEWDNPLLITMDIEKYLHVMDNVDYVLMFNVLHHLLVNKGEERGWKIFNSLLDKCKAIFIMARTEWQKPPTINLSICKHQYQLGEIVKSKTKATWYIDYGELPVRWYGRHVYVFGK